MWCWPGGALSIGILQRRLQEAPQTVTARIKTNRQQIMLGSSSSSEGPSNTVRDFMIKAAPFGGAKGITHVGLVLA